MKKIILPFIFLSVKQTLSAQDHYISNSGDTVKGAVINYKQWDKNPSTIAFRTNNDEIVLNPANCREILIDKSDRYLSYSGTRIINPESVSKASDGPESGILKKDSVNIFLRDIYHYKNYVLYKFFDSKRNNFYLSKNGEIFELEHYESIIDNHVSVYDGYKSLLNDQLSAENGIDLNKKLERVNYDETSLVNFLSGMLNDSVSNSEMKRDQYPREYLVGLGAVANVASLDFVNSNALYSNSSISPVIEIGVRLYNQRNFGKSFFQSVISFSPIKNSFKSNGGLNYNLSSSLFSIYLSSGYTFVKNEKLAVYASAGLGLLVIANLKENTLKSETYAKIGIRPEAGIIISRKINVSAFATAPFKLPAGPSHDKVYKITQVGMSVRYIF